MWFWGIIFWLIVGCAIAYGFGGGCCLGKEKYDEVQD